MTVRGFFVQRPLFAAGIVLTVCCVLVYGRSLTNDFVIWDDDNLVFDNPIVVSVTPASVYKAFTSYDPELYVPLTILSYQVERLAFGFQPFFFHLDNLLLHIGCSILVFALLRKLGLKDAFALTGSLIFALHPLNTEAVAWVSARKDLLCTLFSLLSLAFFMESQAGRKRAWIWSIVFVVLALLSKATAVTVPILMMLIAWKEGRFNSSLIKKVSPHFFLALLFGIIALYGKTQNISEVSGIETILLAFKSFAFSLKQFFIPTNNSILYLQLDSISYTNWTFALSIGLFSLCLLSCTALIRRTKMPLFAFLFYAICLAPSFANFSKAGTIFYFSDRYVYLAQVSLLFGILWLAQKLTYSHKKLYQKGSIVFTTLLIISIGWLAYDRSLVWASSETLYRDALSKNERSVTIHYNLGRLEHERGNRDEALKEYERAIELDPNYAKTWINLGVFRKEEGKTEEALSLFQKASTIDPKAPEPHNNIGSILMDSGKIDQAIEEFKKAIVIDPQFAQAHINLASAYGRKNMFAEGLEEYRIAFSLDPRLQELYPEAAKLLQGL